MSQRDGDRAIDCTPRLFSFFTLFLVPKKDGGQRPVIKPQLFCGGSTFQNHTMKSLLSAEDWLVKIDLKNAYFSIPIDAHHRKYLCF